MISAAFGVFSRLSVSRKTENIICIKQFKLMHYFVNYLLKGEINQILTEFG
jgi:hypothetical protein